MDTFRHVIVTRFNVKVEQANRPGTDWLEHRFSLFERFCLPSVQAQTCQNFTWVLLCDPGIPQEYRDRIRSYARWENLRPIFFKHEFDQGMARAVVAELVRGCSHLITSRLDNDDAICRTFVASVQREFRGQAFEFLNFTNGYVWENGRVWAARHPSNPFISLVERSERHRTVYCGNHMELSEQGPIAQIDHPGAWMQVVHERNLSNRCWGQPMPPETDLRGDFAFKP